MSFKERLFPSLNTDAATYDLPDIKPGAVIPKIIHQTFKSKDLPPELQANIDQLKVANPHWQHRLYDDADIVQFISSVYGDKILAQYERIDPRYGAARADLFRYLLLYKEGGVYLDIKSTFAKPIDEILKPDDQFILTGWDNRPGERREGFGLPKELRHVPGGEFQQWHVICAPGHPFLRAVIQSVLTNIDRYKPWLHGTGGNGVLRLTGPIAYTLAIHPLLPLYPHRYARTDAEMGLVYSMLQTSHKKLFKTHYLTRTDSVITMHGIDNLLGRAYSAARQAKKRLYK